MDVNSKLSNTVKKDGICWLSRFMEMLFRKPKSIAAGKYEEAFKVRQSRLDNPQAQESK